MKALRASGMGFDTIAQVLTSEGIQPRAGARWHGIVVNRILKAQKAP
jgi:hypothetical protein